MTVDDEKPPSKGEVQEVIAKTIANWYWNAPEPDDEDRFLAGRVLDVIEPLMRRRSDRG